MTYTKRILCLANSRKHSGRCIAGREKIELGYGQWIRPISSREGREISELDRRYEDGVKATVLDIVEIPMIQEQPSEFHVEDHLIDDEYHWKKVGEADWNTITSLVEPVTGPLWHNGDSTYHGDNDKIPEAIANRLDSSIKLLRTNDLKILVRLESGFEGRSGKRCVRAEFSISDVPYRLKVTDPNIEKLYLAKNNGTYTIGDAILCVSLAEVWNDYSFKLVAAIFTPNMVR